MENKKGKLIYLFIYFILTYTILNQDLIKTIINQFTNNALIRNIFIFVFYIGLIDIFCLYKIIKKEKKKKYNIKRLIFLSFMIGLLLPYNVIYKTNFSRFAVIFNITILLFSIVSSVLIDYNFFYKKDNLNLSNNIEQLNSYWYFIIPFTSIAITWIKNFPALMSFDSYYQLEQISNNSFNDVHPAAHTLLTKLLLKIYDSPATIVFFQITLLCLGIWWIFKYFSKEGINKKILLGILVSWSCITPLQTTTCYLWKDVFYSISLLFSTILLIKIMINKDTIKFLEVFILGIALAGVFLFRHNGVVPFLFTVISIFYLSYKFKCIKYLLAIVVSLLIIISTKTVVYDLYNVQPNDNGTKYAIFAKAVVSVVANDGSYTEDELEEINKIMPYDVIKRNYDWSQGSNLLWNIQSKDAEYGFGNLTSAQGESVIKLFISLLPKNFLSMFWDIIGSAAIMWQLDFININLFSIHMVYFLPILICVFLFIKNKMYIELIPFIPCIGNVISIVISNISYEARYGYPTMVMLPVILVYSIYSLVLRRKLD